MRNKRVEALREEIAIMARNSQSIFEEAKNLLIAFDDKKLQEVLDMDHHINSLEIKLDEECMNLLALQEPYAKDFRFVFSVVKTNRDLERIGDESKTIAKWAGKIKVKDDDLALLLEKASEILKLAIEAIIESDTKRAEKVNILEDEIDRIEDRIINRTNDLATALIARALERIGDLSTNIAENVIFSVKAEDIRHQGGE